MSVRYSSKIERKCVCQNWNLGQCRYGYRLALRQTLGLICNRFLGLWRLIQGVFLFRRNREPDQGNMALLCGFYHHNQLGIRERRPQSRYLPRPAAIDAQEGAMYPREGSGTRNNFQRIIAGESCVYLLRWCIPPPYNQPGRWLALRGLVYMLIILLVPSS